MTKLRRPLRLVLFVLVLILLSAPFWPWALGLVIRHVVLNATEPPSYWTVLEQNERPQFPQPGKVLPDENAQLPDWAVLPETGELFVREIHPGDGSYGLAATTVVRFQQPILAFMDAYEARLAAAGYEVERTTVTRWLSGDGEWALEAHHPGNGRATFARIFSMFAQPEPIALIVFWDAPVPER